MTTVTSGAADAIAHELADHIGYPRSGDDRRGTNVQQEVREGMADMFADDVDRELYDREDGPTARTRMPDPQLGHPGPRATVEYGRLPLQRGDPYNSTIHA
jgi:hypothetical protein